MKFTRILITIATVGLAALVVNAPVTQAISNSEWKRGRIMDDSVFYNKSSMNVAQIQQFLNAKVPNCDRNGTKPSEFGGGTRAQYGASRGYPAPYTCLKDYHENTNTKVNNLEGRPIPSGAKSAAQIIWDAAQQYNINPQVLIVLLQKEQSLVTDEWPFPIQYRSATGYGCPDSAPCNAEYYGFYNQIQNAAWQFRQYANHPNSFNHAGGQVSFVLYRPNSNCGGTNIHMENQATASLYNYTPYQPNPPLLNGSPDGCSSNGNLNFWHIFNNWFGSTWGTPYAWTVASKRTFVDNTKTAGVHESQLIAGRRYYVQIKARNTGNVAWTKNAPNRRVNVVPMRPFDRRSPFCDSTWINHPERCNRAATMIENDVAPGGIGTFEFWITAPNKAGTYKEYFGLIMDGTSPLQDPGLYWRFTVSPHTYRWQPVSKSSYMSDAKGPGVHESQLVAGQRYYLQIKARNTGNTTWTKSTPNRRVNVVTTHAFDRKSPFCDSTWINHPNLCNRTATMLENDVPPGGIGTFEFWITAPSQPGTYNEYYSLIMDGTARLNDPGLYWRFTVKQP